MAVGADLAGAPVLTTHGAARRLLTVRPESVVPVLLVWQSLALLGQAVAAALARQGTSGALAVSTAALTLTYASAVVVLTRRDLTHGARNAVVVCLTLTTTLQWRSTDPLLFTGFDEQLHMRTLTDVVTSHDLFAPHPLLAVSPHYPGLETTTALLMQLGLPTMAAAMTTVIAARLVLGLVLSAAVERATGSVRAGGVAVAVYAVSPQFVFFNSQFSYQTLAMPLALAGIALVARSRSVDDARLLLGCATVCLLAVAVSHHVTSLLTAAFLVMWAAVARGGRAVRRVRLAAAVAVGSTGLWALVQWSLLREYFGPIVEDVGAQLRGSTERRQAFADPSGYQTPEWQRIVLLYYAAIVSLTALVLVLRSLRPAMRPGSEARHARTGLTAPTPRLLVLLLAAVVPAVFAARVLPSGGEFGDRATSFLFLPFSLLVAATVTGLRRPPRLPRPLVRATVVVLASLTFLGGYLLGSGPDWQRLPGSYLPSAEGRSMDSETLAAVAWAGENLPAGSRVVADRISSDLLSSRARLWPVLREDDLDAPSLYFADTWGQPQTDLVAGLRLHYLYVDERLASGLPRVGSYFYRGETEGPTRLTLAQLRKFDDVSGIEVAYRHGPVTIYDLSGLGGPVETSGWTGERTPPSVLVQVLTGIGLGAALTLVARRRPGRVVARAVRRLREEAGPAFVLAVAVATVCTGSVVLILCGVWLGPWTLLAALLTGAPALRGRRLTIRGRRWPGRRQWLLLAAAGVLTATAAAVSVTSAYSADVHQVREILDDPAAIHEAPR